MRLQLVRRAGERKRVIDVFTEKYLSLGIKGVMAELNRL